MNWIIRSIILTLLIQPIAAVAADYSGFLDDYPAMQADENRATNLSWKKANLDLGSYDKVLLDAITLYYHPKAENKGISPDRLKTLTDAFYRSIQEAFEPDYPLVSKPGPGVLRIRLAITEIEVKKAKMGAKHLLLPGGFGLYAVDKKSGKLIHVENAVLEGELLDSETGERLEVLIDSKPQRNESNQKKKKPSWKDIEATLDYFSKRLRDRLDKAHSS